LAVLCAAAEHAESSLARALVPHMRAEQVPAALHLSAGDPGASHWLGTARRRRGEDECRAMKHQPEKQVLTLGARIRCPGCGDLGEVVPANPHGAYPLVWVAIRWTRAETPPMVQGDEWPKFWGCGCGGGMA